MSHQSDHALVDAVVAGDKAPFAELVRRGGGPMDILPELGVLTVYAVVLLLLARWRLRVAITRP